MIMLSNIAVGGFMMKLLNKVAIVTGGASGIGEATVRLFAAEGATVIIADFSDRGTDISAELKAEGHRVSFIKTDVRDAEQVKKMVAECVNNFGAIDILYANAGIAADAPITELGVDTWKHTIDINLTGVFLFNKFVITQMLNQPLGGVIVNCGSIHSFAGKKGVTAYASAKGGVKLLTQSLALDYADKNIRVNAVCPGYIDTPLIKGRDAAITEALVALHPMGRLGTPEEVAKAVLFLASDDSSFVTGTTLLVDGGYTAQ